VYHSNYGAPRLRGILVFFQSDDYAYVSQRKSQLGGFMHDVLIALAFIGMVIAPAIVAANSTIGKNID
jgi:hypothetical protein